MFQIPITIGLSLLCSMFNVYFANVITGYNSNSYPSYNFVDQDDNSKKEYQIQLDNYNKIKNHKNIALIIIGILYLIVSFFINQQIIKMALLFAGIMTLIYAIGSSWDQYNDFAKMMATGFGIIVIVVLLIKYSDIYKFESIKN